MPSVEVFAFPALLVAAYVVFRLGRRRPSDPPSAFDAARLLFQGALLGTLGAVGARLLDAGALSMPLGMWAPALAVTGVAGLIAVDAVDLARRRSGARAVPPVPPATPAPGAAPGTGASVGAAEGRQP